MKIVRPGYIYHIKDEFFEVAKDSKLMQNKCSRSRPTLILKSKNSNYWWAIPMTSKIEKAKKIKNYDEQKHHNSLKVVIGEYCGKEVAFLLQNMYPISEQYIDHIHKMDSKAIPISEKMLKKINHKINRITNLLKAGHQITYTNIPRLTSLLKENAQKQEPREYHEHINEKLMTVIQAQKKTQAKKKEAAKNKNERVKAYQYDER